MAHGANGAAPSPGAVDCSRILSEGLFVLVAMGTANDALLTRFRATHPGPATPAMSPTLDERRRFLDRGCAKIG